jgi:hypothetical protein
MLFLILQPERTLAQKNFSTSIISTYTVQPNEKTIVDQRITLTNNSSEYFPKEYSMLIATDNIDSIRARDGKGSILRDYRKSDNLTQISLVFNDKVIGKNSQLKFRVSYKTKELTIKKDNGWQVYIPATPESENIEKYTAVLKVPKNFPKKVEFSIKPIISRNREYIWGKDQLKGASASANFISIGQKPVDNNTAKQYNRDRTSIKSILRQLVAYLFSFLQHR